MGFQAPITVMQALDSIRMRRYLMPSIQRGVVWSHEQIERLFDSLMRDYPIGSFLFWRVEKSFVGKYQFYEFIENYHERDTIDNPKANVPGTDEIIGVLDGQQRLTALHIGLGGWYAYKIPWKRWDNDAAFPSRKLYLNLLAQTGRDDMEYDFRFLTDEEAKEKDNKNHWFKVEDIRAKSKIAEIAKYLRDNNLEIEITTDHNSQDKNPSDILYRLFEVVHLKPVINYYLETDQDLNKVLNIFIRVNSGGTQLSYSDLLLSIASASWQKRNAREVIHNLVKEINDIGDKFNFNKDFILKACLLLCDFPNIEFNVKNFDNNNMKEIENKWDDIAEAIKTAVEIVSSLGFNRDTLTSNHAVIPIAYYAIKRSLSKAYIHSLNSVNDINNIQKWLAMCLLKRVFGAHADNVLNSMRDTIRQHIEDHNKNSFPYDEIKNVFKGTQKSLIFTDDEIENLFTYSYGQAYTFSTLALLYPSLDYRNKFHLDHMHPKSIFKKSQLQKLGLTDDQIDFYQNNCNGIANLQLLEGPINLQKGNMSLVDWINKICHTQQEKDNYMGKHYIPLMVSLDLSKFEGFVNDRKELMTKQFKVLLQ